MNKMIQKPLELRVEFKTHSALYSLHIELQNVHSVSNIPGCFLGSGAILAGPHNFKGLFDG